VKVGDKFEICPRFPSGHNLAGLPFVSTVQRILFIHEWENIKEEDANLLLSI
jgi:hypothetical protein